MSEKIHITRTTEGYMGPMQQLAAEFATATAKLSRWHTALGDAGALESQVSLPDGRQVEVRSAGVDSAVMRVMHVDGNLGHYNFSLQQQERPLIFEAFHMQDPEVLLDRHVVEADAEGLARAQEFGHLLSDCVDELPLHEDL